MKIEVMEDLYMKMRINNQNKKKIIIIRKRSDLIGWENKWGWKKGK